VALHESAPARPRALPDRGHDRPEPGQLLAWPATDEAIAP